MTYLILGLVIFFAAHLFSAFRSREPGKDLKQNMGNGPFMGLFSLVSIIGFALICYGYGASRPSINPLHPADLDSASPASPDDPCDDPAGQLERPCRSYQEEP